MSPVIQMYTVLVVNTTVICTTQFPLFKEIPKINAEGLVFQNSFCISLAVKDLQLGAQIKASFPLLE